MNRMKRILALAVLAVSILALSGCGTLYMQFKLTWSSGDLDLWVKEPDGKWYCTWDDPDTTLFNERNSSNGSFSADYQNGGNETYTLYLLHDPGFYEYAITNNEAYDINCTVTVTKGLNTEVYTYTAYADSMYTPGQGTTVKNVDESGPRLKKH